MKTGIIGLGAMGAPMARNLAKAGHLHRIWNRSRERATTLAEELGLEAAPSCAALAADCEIILTCVSADADLLAVIDQLLPGLKPGQILVDLSTVSSETARRAARILQERSCGFLDAPVSGGVEGAKNGTLAIMIGGDPAQLARARPVLDALGSRIVHMGDVGAGQGTKAVNQVMAAGINQAVTEALAFGQAQGLDMDNLIDVISGGAAGNWFLQQRGKNMIEGHYPPGFKLALHHKDLEICRRMAAALATALPLTDTTLADYQRLMKAGHGEEDISALYRLKRPG